MAGQDAAVVAVSLRSLFSTLAEALTQQRHARHQVDDDDDDYAGTSAGGRRIRAMKAVESGAGETSPASFK